MSKEAAEEFARYLLGELDSFHLDVVEQSTGGVVGKLEVRDDLMRERITVEMSETMEGLIRNLEEKRCK